MRTRQDTGWRCVARPVMVGRPGEMAAAPHTHAPDDGYEAASAPAPAAARAGTGTSPPQGAAARVLALQRSAGNAAVAGLLQREPGPAPAVTTAPPPAAQPAPG